MSKRAAGRVPKKHILEGCSLDLATDAMEMPLSWGAYPSSSRDDRKLNKIVPHDVIEIDDDDDQDEVLVIGEFLSSRIKRQTVKTMNVSKNVIKKPILIIDDDTDVKCQAFKQFDTVRDSSDHHFNKPEILKMTPAIKEQPGKNWVKRIQHEWKVLEKDLPETIYVRIFEDRMDILRAVIIGPAGTPYHDGLFFFDIYFPPTFPLVPPMVHYHSGGLRLNPNLYQCGKVCLSLLNTWPGQGCETWNSSNSTILQVLVSIQALVLNAKPYFNEPGFELSVNTPYGRKESLAYNETAFILSCKTMLYSLRKAPKHFEEFVAGHFRSKGSEILEACIAYMKGAQVGCVFVNGVRDVDSSDKSSSSAFKENLSTIYDQLVMEFTGKGTLSDKLS
ncbi:putative ubiquitin-conjugating enzyme E2 38 [Phalaenopsis equestris]|uniref:putative ubiquitin-conjugating enzyme E2 38 n=1 Tax=Phalaenopsis equestris TaxID=78828 RepID=UPI0009E2FC86|nr:putative ubiquitin-conjugating enzyme E2 38 [Phalaenopsis equestris]